MQIQFIDARTKEPLPLTVPIKAMTVIPRVGERVRLRVDGAPCTVVDVEHVFRTDAPIRLLVTIRQYEPARVNTVKTKGF